MVNLNTYNSLYNSVNDFKLYFKYRKYMGEGLTINTLFSYNHCCQLQSVKTNNFFFFCIFQTVQLPLW